jgi:RNA polymerase sigma factor (sigma-70 family)
MVRTCNQRGDTMATAQLHGVLRHLRRAALLQDERSDGQLLECFVGRREQAAFEVLVQRHGPMVWGVCRRVLHNEADAEDAFQATFLVLVRKAAAITDRATVGNWLYGVAHNTALKARAMTGRRRVKEREAAGRPRPGVKEDVGDDLRLLLDEELGRLPDRYRAAIVLCDLEGQPIKEAARLLGCPQGTVTSRLTRGRKLLAGRLARRGVALSGVPLAGVLGREATAALVPPPLVLATIKAASSAAGQAGAGGISAKVAALTKGVLTSMFSTNGKLAAVLLLILGACGVGVGLFVYRGEAAARGGHEPPPRDPGGAKTPQADLQVAAVLKEAAATAGDIEDKQWKAWTFQNLGEVQAKAGDKAAAARGYQEAIRAAKEIKEDAQVHHTIGWIAVSQVKTGDVKGGLETARAIEDDAGRDYALAAVAVAQVQAGDVKGALQTAEDVSFDKKAWVHSAIAWAHAAAGNIKEARAAAAKAGDDPPMLGAIAAAQVRAKDREGAKKTVQEILKIAGDLPEGVAGTGEDGSRRAAAFGAAARVLAEMGDVREARQAADALKEPRWQSNALRNIATAQVNAGDLKGALQTAEAIEEEYQKGEAHNEVVTAQVRSGDLEAGRKTAESIKSAYWRVAALAEIAKGEAKAGDRAAAAKTFQKAVEETGKEAGNVRDEEPGLGGLRNGSLCLIVRAQAEAGQERDAYAWAVKQSSPLLKAKALIEIAHGMEIRKQTEKRPPK